MNRQNALIGFACFCLLVPAATAQEAALTVRDLDGKNPKKLALEELNQLLPGAKMSRLTKSGWQHNWTNEAGGAFIVSAANRNPGAMRSTASSASSGKWHISNDGRYCILIEWKAYPTEEWCRYVIQTSEGYYLAKSDAVKTEAVYKIDIKK